MIDGCCRNKDILPDCQALVKAVFCDDLQETQVGIAFCAQKYMPEEQCKNNEKVDIPKHLWYTHVWLCLRKACNSGKFSMLFRRETPAAGNLTVDGL